MKLRIKKTNPNAVIPKYAHEGDSGFDLVATEDVVVFPSETVKVPIGLAFDIPEGYEIQIRPRSGVTSKTKLRVQFGTVDSNYKGEVEVVVDNISAIDPRHASIYGIDGKRLYADDEGELKTHIIQTGDRIAQGVVAPVKRVDFEESDDVGESERGEGGFGSTGVKL